MRNGSNMSLLLSSSIGDETADQRDEVDGFKEEIDAALCDVWQLNVQPAAVAGAGNVAKNGVLRTG